MTIITTSAPGLPPISLHNEYLNAYLKWKISLIFLMFTHSKEIKIITRRSQFVTCNGGGCPEWTFRPQRTIIMIVYEERFSSGDPLPGSGEKLWILTIMWDNSVGLHQSVACATLHLLFVFFFSHTSQACETSGSIWHFWCKHIIFFVCVSVCATHTVCRLYAQSRTNSS